ncbi:hypothetical protein MYX07_02275 [Patescibacteria group bacterium AH-259-L07]|nr:hypothetical protein [Patescibacteria group bacterium AH-259-L07]
MEKTPGIKPVEKEIREETLEKLEILDTHDKNFELANKGEFLGSDFNQYLEELKEQGILKFTRSPSKINWNKRKGEQTNTVRVIEPIDKEGTYLYGGKQSIHASAHGNIFNSLPQLREKTIQNEQPQKRRSKERPKKDTERLKHFEELTSEPLKLLSNLEEKFKKEDASPIDILENHARQLNRAIKNNDYSNVNALIAELGDLGIEYPGEFNRDMFENTILPEAEKEGLIEKTSENAFPREEIEKAKKENRHLMDKPKWEEIYYQWWENAYGGIGHTDVYTFKGNKKIDAQRWIFDDLKDCAIMVGDIEWIKSSIERWRNQHPQEEKIPEKTQREADRKATEKATEKFTHRQSKTEEEKKKEREEKRKARQEAQKSRKGKKRTFSWDELAEVKKHLEEQAEKKSTTKKTPSKKKTN